MGDFASIASEMRRIEPGFRSWSVRDINELTQAIVSCGYIWQCDERGVAGFYHPVSGLWLNVPGLHLHSPETILDTYETVWSKDSWEKSGARDRSQEASKKAGCGCLIVAASPLIFWLVDPEYAWAIVGLLAARQVILLWRMSQAKSNYLNAK